MLSHRRVGAIISGNHALNPRPSTSKPAKPKTQNHVHVLGRLGNGWTVIRKAASLLVLCKAEQETRGCLQEDGCEG